MKRGEMLGTAIIIATQGHAGQFDRGGKPYILHPLKVMYYLKTDDEELQCVAVLHDLVEDTKVTYKELLEAGISQRVINGIASVTKLPGESYEEYQEKVMSNIDGMKVKLCDLRHNTDIRRLKGVTDKDIERIAKYQRFYIKIQQKLAV